ncbi:MAG: chorismate mutase [Deltaproteobacteria bacterium]|nr:chorismate mutase [Deltaproteobacteria bacterium]
MNDALRDLRGELDAVDRQLVALLARRAHLVARAWAVKDAQGLPRRDEAREREIHDALLAQAQSEGLDPAKVRAVLGRIVGVDLRGDG